MVEVGRIAESRAEGAAITFPIPDPVSATHYLTEYPMYKHRNPATARRFLAMWEMLTDTLTPGDERQLSKIARLRDVLERRYFIIV